MLRQIAHSEIDLLKDDPVRPHISAAWRIDSGGTVYVLENDQTKLIDAVVCVRFMDTVPTCEQEMQTPGSTVAVFYTVWSYSKGAGRDIIFAAQSHILENHPLVKRFVTLSPLTEMAERFHLKNGAELIGVWETCQNFEYK